MERYALRILQQAIPAPPGLRVIVVRVERAEDGSIRLNHETLPVVGLQSQVIHHYISDDPRPVHPDPVLMERLGWHYKHQECRYAPVCITADGRLDALNPDDPEWLLVEPGTPDDRVELIARRLKDKEGIRRTLEKGVEERDQDNEEGD